MDCPGGHVRARVAGRGDNASTLVLMDCPGGPAALWAHLVVAYASTLVLMDCPGGPRSIGRRIEPPMLQPLF